MNNDLFTRNDVAEYRRSNETALAALRAKGTQSSVRFRQLGQFDRAWMFGRRLKSGAALAETVAAGVYSVQFRQSEHGFPDSPWPRMELSRAGALERLDEALGRGPELGLDPLLLDLARTLRAQVSVQPEACSQ